MKELESVYGGKVFSHDKNLNTFRWVLSKRNDVIFIQNNYFKLYPARSKKINRINLISLFYKLKDSKEHLNKPISKNWINLLNKWEKFNPL